MSEPSPITIDSVSLDPYLQWIDEFSTGSDLVGQQETISITGALVVQASAQQAGRLMTLQTNTMEGDTNSFAGVLTRAQVNALRTLAATPGAVYVVTMPDGRTFNVMFRRSGNAAVDATQILFQVPIDDGDWYSVTINLIQV